MSRNKNTRKNTVTITETNKFAHLARPRLANGHFAKAPEVTTGGTSVINRPTSLPSLILNENNIGNFFNSFLSSQKNKNGSSAMSMMYTLDQIEAYFTDNFVGTFSRSRFSFLMNNLINSSSNPKYAKSSIVIGKTRYTTFGAARTNRNLFSGTFSKSNRLKS